MEAPVPATILDQIRSLATPLNAKERLALIQTIADMPPAVAIAAPPSAQRRNQLAAEQAAWYARPPGERARFGHTPVLIIRADWDEAPVYTIYSPRLER